MNQASTTPPDGALPPEAEETVGVAEMLEDGTLRLALRTVADDGTIGEALLVIKPDDERYGFYATHLKGLAPGQSQPIPPFPDEEERDY